MPTTNPRVNVTLTPELAAILALLAKREKGSMSTVAKRMIEEAIEEYEDLALSRLAEKVDVPGAKRFSHADVRRKFLGD